MDLKKEKLIEKFRQEVCDKYRCCEDLEEVDWYALSIGFFLAKGTDVPIAAELAGIVRYDFHYWVPNLLTVST